MAKAKPPHPKYAPLYQVMQRQMRALGIPGPTELCRCMKSDPRTYQRVLIGGANGQRFLPTLKLTLNIPDDEWDAVMEYAEEWHPERSPDLNRRGYKISTVEALIADPEVWRKFWDDGDAIIQQWKVPSQPGSDLVIDSERFEELAKASPDTHFRLTDERGKLIAIWSLQFVLPEVYDKIIDGKNVHSNFSRGDLDQRIVPGGRYRLYISDLFYRDPKPDRAAPVPYFKAVLTSIAELLDRMSDPRNDYDIYVERVAALLTTQYVVSLCQRLNFKFVKDHDVNKMFDESGEEVPAKVVEVDTLSFFQNNRARTFLRDHQHLCDRYIEYYERRAGRR